MIGLSDSRLLMCCLDLELFVLVGNLAIVLMVDRVSLNCGGIRAFNWVIFDFIFFFFFMIISLLEGGL